jgi:hypothetical protein
MSDKNRKFEDLRRKGGEVLAFLKNKSPEQVRPYLTKRNFIITIIVLFFLAQYVQVSRVTGGVSNLSLKGSSLVDEVGRLNEMTSLFADDLTEVRSYLLLPTRQYSSLQDFDEGGAGTGDMNSDALQVALFKYVGHLASEKNLENRLSGGKEAFGALRSDQEFLAYLGAQALTLSKVSDGDEQYAFSVFDANGRTVLYLYLDKLTGGIYQKSVNILEEVKFETAYDFVKGVRNYLKENLSEILKTITAVDETMVYVVETFSTEDVVALLAGEGLKFAPEPMAVDFKVYYDIKNLAGEAVAQIVFDKQDLSLSLLDSRDEDNIVLQVTDLLSALPPFIGQLDVLPSAQKNVIEAQESLRETFEDKGFKLLLSEAGFVVETEPREDEYRYYYDIKMESDGVLIGSIVIEKSNGLVEVVGPDGAGTQNLLFFETGLGGQDGLKKKL